MWAGGGSWDDPGSGSGSGSAPSDPAPREPAPGERTQAKYGASERRGARGVVCGRFHPLHRGHMFVIEFARASVERLTIFVLEHAGEEVPGALRARWITEQYPDAEVHVMAAPGPAPGSAPPAAAPALAPAELARLIGERVPKVTHFFGSELAYRAVADALSARFVPVDPARAAVPISGSAIRANVMEHFHALAPSARPSIVRRVAVVGAESTGKTTLCAALRERLGALVVPEWTRTLVEADDAPTLLSESIQLAARGQIAAEDALARQLAPGASGGLLLCDTDLRTIVLWAQRLYLGRPPRWITEQVLARPYDLYLLCAPDIPFIGRRDRDLPELRAQLHGNLRSALGGQPVVELRGGREERVAAAADAIINLFAPGPLLSARGRAGAS